MSSAIGSGRQSSPVPSCDGFYRSDVPNASRDKCVDRFDGIQTRKRIASTYASVGVGLGISTATAVATAQAGLILANPAVMMAAGMSGIGLLVGTMVTDPDNVGLKSALYAGFAAAMGVVLGSLGILGAPVLLQAGLITSALAAALSVAAFMMPPGTFSQYGGAVTVGIFALTIFLTFTCFIPISWPLFATLNTVEMYAGLALFGASMLVDTDTMLQRAANNLRYDAINESLGIYLNTINIFIRIAELVARSRK